MAQAIDTEILDTDGSSGGSSGGGSSGGGGDTDGSSGGSSDTGGRTVTDTTTRPDVPDTEQTTVPEGAYRKQRFDNVTLSGTPVESVLAEIVSQRSGLTNVSYRWQGLQQFEAGEYRFSMQGQDGIRLTVASDVIIDGWVSSPRRTLQATKDMPAGESLVTADWFKGEGTMSVRMTYEKVAVQEWISCEDGETHQGAPPDGWILTKDACWKSPIPSDTGSVNLAEVVQIIPSPSNHVERAYVLGSGVTLTPYVLDFYNRSTNMSVKVAISGPSAVRFSRSAFELTPRASSGIRVDFITSEMDKLSEGLNLSSIIVTLTAGTITLNRNADDSIEIGPPTSVISIQPIDIPLVDPIITPPPTPTWCDASGVETVQREGFPPANWILRVDGCYVPPAVIAPQVSLSATFSEGQPKLLADGENIAIGSLAATIAGDDPNTWSWAWDLDVQEEGAGTGRTDARSLTVKWTMTEQDLRSLEDSGETSRTVAVVARKGNDVLRSRFLIKFKNPALAFVTQPKDTTQTTTTSTRRTTIVKDIGDISSLQ